MYNRIQNSAQDIALRDIVINSSSESRFPWDQRLASAPAPSITILHGDSEHTLNIGGIANLVGATVTDICLLQGIDLDDQIFSDTNQQHVEEIAHATVERLAQSSQGNAIRVTYEEIYQTVSNVLISKDRFELAKALMFRQSLEQGEDGDSNSSISIRLIRRNGNVVPWKISKIKNAVERAFLAISQEPVDVELIAKAIESKVIKQGENFINIEDVQDLVQRELMIQGHFAVAEHYILYRSERARVRAEKEQSAIVNNDPQQEAMILVTDENGSEFWDGFELKKRIQFASIGLNLCVDEVEIEQELRRSIPSEISRTDLKKTIILNAKSLLERDADFAKFAGRILLSYIYEEVIEWDIMKDGIEMLKEAHQRHFKKYIEHAIKIERVSPDLLSYDLDQIASFLDPTADLDFDYLGIQTLYDRYLIIDKTGEQPRRVETPQYFWMRVAMGLFKNEPENKEEWVQKLYKLYKGRRFCSSTPTLFNSGTLHSQLSSCYLYKIDDSIESIMQRGIADNAYLSKWAGGLGGSWTSVRGLGSYIKGTNGESQGVIPFLKLHNDQLVAVNQGGKRRGSGCAYLETWHNDMYDFLELRIGVGDERRRTHDMNTANWIPDLFMQRMEQRKDWTLFRANETPDLHELYGSAFKDRYEAYEAQAAEGKIWTVSYTHLTLPTTSRV